ncbi:hypothetical protein LS684_14275 [Cytobacillus spongiae]|nr:hypothetical protein LS684_14275 [Cytobacillus spongiae]
MKQRTSFYFVMILIALGALGVISRLINNPGAFIQSIVVIVIVGAVFYFIYRKMTQSSPQKQEQRAFVKAAKRSKKRFQKSESGSNRSLKKSNLGSLTKLKSESKKKSSSHLTVIEGKKGKKKNRASL